MRLSRDLLVYRRLWSVPNVRWLTIIQFFAELTLYSTVIVRFQSERGLNYTAMFALESLLSLAVFAFEVSTGVLADRLGYRSMLIVGQGCKLVSYILFAVANGFGLFALSTLFFGVGIACISGCESALVYESLPKQERDSLATPAFSLLSAASSAGFVGGTAVGSFLGAANAALPVALNIIPMALAWLAAWKLRPVDGSRESAEPSPGELVRSALALVHADRIAVGLSLFGTLAFALTNAVFWYNQPVLGRAGMPVAWFGPITALGMMLQMLLALAAPAAIRLLRPQGALMVACLLPAVGYASLSLSTSPLITTLLLLAVIGGSAWRQPVLSAELNRRIPDGSRATTLSALSFLGTLGGIAVNPLIGLGGDYGVMAVVVGMGMGLTALAATVPFLMRTHKNRAQG